MSSREIAQIRKALAGATGRHLQKAAAAQQAEPLTLRSAPSQRAAASILAGLFKGTGAEEKFAATLARDKANRAAALEKAKATAIKKSRANLAVLQSQADRRVKDLERLTAFPAGEGSPKYHLLNKPMFILPSRTIALDESEVIPRKSFAKFQGQTKRDLQGDVQFWYLWDNPVDRFSVINVDGYIIFNGHGKVEADGGFFAGSRSASLKVTGRLNILEWENQPPTQPISQPNQSVDALSLSVRPDDMFDDAEVKLKDIFRGYDLRHSLLVVPPLATLIFTVVAEVSIGCGSDSGMAEFDFSSGDFQVGSPAVLVTLLS